MHTYLIVAYAMAFAAESPFDQNFFLFCCFGIGVTVLARTVNACWLLRYNYQQRIYCVCGVQVVSYVFMISAWLIDGYGMSLALISVAALISTAATAIGEAALFGYMKGFPHELIAYIALGKTNA